ncbi:MAG: hypothetical protein EXS08_00475 [Planctomycetes bacterium]|nr:hypothetical protein [Planctomycetota bacterium]
MLGHASLGLRELSARIGREESLTSFHSAVLRAAHTLRPVVESGAVLAACSDEFNGEIRAAFERDVARMLTAPDVPGTRRVFSLANLGGRIEPGAIALANLHFTARSAQAGEKLLLIEIASHVGRRETTAGTRWGELDRFGTSSPCCGALRLLLDAPQSAAAVRFPWYDQLTAFFGPERLGTLRADTSPYAMVRAAIVHAVLQSESAIVDLLREPPTTPTHVLLVALAVVNRRGPDNCIPVGVHHLRFHEGLAEIEHGHSLRSTPESLAIDVSKSLITVRSPFEDEPAPPPRAPRHGPPLPAGVLGHAHEQDVRTLVAHSRKQLAHLRGRQNGMRLYARPLLRGFLQSLSVRAPEVGLAALALEGEHSVFRVAELAKVLARGASIDEARRVLHDLEPTLQQLGHPEASALLEALLDAHHPLLGS